MDWYWEFLRQSFTDLEPTRPLGPVDPWLGCSCAKFHEDYWYDLLGKDPYSLLPALPHDPSPHRPGMAQWDAIAANGLPSFRAQEVLDPKNRASVPNLRHKEFNTWWYESIRPRRARCERFSEKYAETMKGTDRGRLLNDRAHCLAHLRGDEATERVGDLATHGFTAFELIKAAAELFVAERFELPLTWEPGNRVSLPHGVFVYPDVRVGFGENPPEARLPVPSKTHKIFDDVSAVILVVVELGQDPRILARMRPSPLDDWWSYQPVAMYVAGWETAAWMSLQRVRAGLQIGYSPTPKLEFVSPVNDLLPPQLLEKWLPEGRPGTFEESVAELVDKWEHRTPMFPCNSCLCYSGEVDDGLVKPRGFKPKQWKVKDGEEWLEYREKLRLAMSQIDKAKKAYYGSGYVRDRALRRRGYEAHRRAVTEKRRKRNKW